MCCKTSLRHMLAILCIVFAKVLVLRKKIYQAYLSRISVKTHIYEHGCEQTYVPTTTSADLLKVQLRNTQHRLAQSSKEQQTYKHATISTIVFSFQALSSCNCELITEGDHHYFTYCDGAETIITYCNGTETISWGGTCTSQPTWPTQWVAWKLETVIFASHIAHKKHVKVPAQAVGWALVQDFYNIGISREVAHSWYQCMLWSADFSAIEIVCVT